MATSRQLSFVGPRTVSIVEAELPALGAGQVMIRTLFSGISSGTEQLAYRGELPADLPVDETIGALSGTFSYPFRYGYSCVGVAEQSRCDVREGDMLFAFQPHQDRFIIDGADAIAIGDLPARTATLLPLVETALQISLDADTAPGSAVVVFGCGVVGSVTAWLLARAGARVVAVDPAEPRRAAAGALGVVTACPDDVGTTVAAHCGRPLVPLVIEASGNPSVLGPALSLLEHEGVALVASWYGTKQVTLPLGGPFHRRRLSIRSTQVSTIPSALQADWDIGRRRRAAAGLLGELPLERLATHVFAFDEAASAYEALAADPRVIHAALGYG